MGLGSVGLFLSRDESGACGGGKRRGRLGCDGPEYRKETPQRPARTMQRGARSLILGSDDRLCFQPGVGPSFLANWCRPGTQLLLSTCRDHYNPSHHLTIAALSFPHINQDAVAQRAEYWRMEDALVEKAAKLLTSKV